MTDSEQKPDRKHSEGTFGVSGLEELARLENDLVDIEKVQRDNPTAISAKELKIAQLRRELFLSEHDNAGAFKFKRFGREMGKDFLGPSPDFEKNEEGELKIAKNQEQRRFLFVNMGELDRFNKEGGGHAAGDAALKATATAIEKAIIDQMKEKSSEKAGGYTMFRYTGNEFMVQLSDISDDDFKALSEKIKNAAPTVEGVKDPAPLSVVSFDAKDVVEQFNDTQAELATDKRAETPAENAREFITTLRKSADFQLEREKFIGRARRVKEKLETDPSGAGVFFKNYMEKTFQGTPLGTLEAFQNLVANPGAFDTAVSGFAEEAAKQRFSDQRKQEAHLWEGFSSQDIDFFLKGDGKQEASPKGKSVFSEDFPVAKVPERTAGQLKIDQLALSVAEKTGAPADLEQARLEYEIEIARRDMGTGLLERGVHYEALQKDLEKEGGDTATVFVDMGFLKYFDKKGGNEVGNNALKAAADLLQRTLDTATLDGKPMVGQAYRYGGDEFTVQLQGGKPATQAFLKQLYVLRDEMGKIPATDKSEKEYAPATLVFNTGVCDKAMLDAAFNDIAKLVESGGTKLYTPEELKDPARVAEIKAELMTKIADIGVEGGKAVNRLRMLIRELRDPAYKTDPRRRSQVDSLVSFSNKAIFAEQGGDVVLRTWAELSEEEMTEEELELAIQKFVTDRMEASKEIDKETRERVDRIVEIHAKVAKLEEEVADLSGRVGEQSGRIETLRKALDAAKREREEILNVRKKLDSPSEAA